MRHQYVEYLTPEIKPNFHVKEDLYLVYRIISYNLNKN